MRALFLLTVFCLASCSGYNYNKHNNPFAKYGVKTLAVPMFLNQSVLPNVSGPMTKEMVLMLGNFAGLRVKPGNAKDVDAVLLGIVNSEQYYRETVKTVGQRLIHQAARESTKDRPDQFVPFFTQIGLQLDLILIKNPRMSEIKFLTSPLGRKVKQHPKIIFRETIGLQDKFVRQIQDRTASNDAGTTNFTQNLGIQNRGIKRMAQYASVYFKELILDAF